MAMIPSAHLRVFQPLDAFERDEQLHWERYLVERAGRGGSPSRRRYDDAPGAGQLGTLRPANGEHAEIRIIDGRTYLSPWRSQLQTLAATAGFHEAARVELATSYVSRKQARRARRELARLRRRDPLSVSFCHSSTWHVPIRWFMLFQPDERRLAQTGDGRPRLLYRTSARAAIRRAEVAIPVLRRSDLSSIGELLLDLHQWLTLFDRGSLLELDYGDLTELLDAADITEERSVGEVGEALEMLSRYDYPQAAEAYQGVLVRWAELRSREVMS
jgi:hypothetical protein